MDHGACNIIYLDRRARGEGIIKKDLAHLASGRLRGIVPDYFDVGGLQVDEVEPNIRSILSTFNEVYVCNSGATFLSRIHDLNDSKNEPVPTILIIDIPYDEEHSQRRASRGRGTTSSAFTERPVLESPGPDDIYGMHLLLHISSEIQQQNLSKLFIPVAVLTGVDQTILSQSLSSPNQHGSQILADPVRMTRYLDAGAVDVLTSPMSKNRVHGLAVHAYRGYKEYAKEEFGFLNAKRNRKLSWVGVEEAKPYAYLREAMVSNLMDGICNPENVSDSIDPSEVQLDPGRHDVVAKAVGTWDFSAHDFTYDELLHGAQLMYEHALKMPELENWRLTTNELTTFLVASRAAYNEFVLYHNFRHVVDVLQALFYFLVQIGTLPPYPDSSSHIAGPSSPIASLLKPFDALTLLISAIGHDVGHPGVNNAFLVALNAPLAQLYNDRSVLEAFHCAAYSQILRRCWPAAFSDLSMRKLMINSILATDMGLHFKYMSDLGNLQEKLAHDGNSFDTWDMRACQEYKDLTCGILIKCADISNVARKFDVAAKWSDILTDEFSNQGAMEKVLNLPTCLFGGPPVRDDIIKMGESQIGFMNIFARPLFEAVTDILPRMKFSVDELTLNKAVWEKKIEQERQRRKFESPRRNLETSTPASPMSRSNVDLTEARTHHQSDPMPSIPTIVSRHSPSTPTRTSVAENESRRSSEGTPSHIAHLQQGTNRSRRSSLAPSAAEHPSRRSSGAFVNHAPVSSPFGPPVSQSRRSSKDMAQSQLPFGTMSNSLDVENHTVSESRRGSADASLTTIFVTSPGSGKTDAQNCSAPSSPRKTSPTMRSQPSNPQSQPPNARFSIPSSRSHATSSATAPTTQPCSPTTQASSLVSSDNSRAERDAEPAEDGPFAVYEDPFRFVKSAPDIRLPEDKQSVLSAVVSGSSEEGRAPGGRNAIGVRESRSRSRLRGLRFWKKRWKSPPPEVESASH
ncbi:3',5'-cyclic-nucleotide phosphodiesterase [Cryomyces antarcticus]|uniref:Phosphodiesterase n=1 Tax=Cryomyces antarcticus TaxID=329879 RepID=A0ABR0M1W5_9PEZI|nr:3',5'-cyclic-nucleotide phosphodiesterase [Cryomyces antarcticus]